MRVSLLRYAIVYLATLIALGVIGYLLLRFLQTDLPSGLGAVLPPLLGAMTEGQRIARTSADPIESNEAWRAAAAMTIVAVIINAIQFGMVLMIPGAADALTSVSPALLIGLTVFLLGGVFLVNRFFLTMGYKTQRKAMDRAGK